MSNSIDIITNNMLALDKNLHYFDIMRTLRWRAVAPKGEAYHVVSLTLRGRAHYHVHTHDFAELFLVDRGTGLHRLTTGVVPLSEGDVVTVCPGQAHGFKACTPEGFRYLNVAFPAATLNRLREEYLSCEDPFWRAGDTPHSQRLGPAKTQTLVALIDQLATAPRNQFSIDRFLLNLIYELRRPALCGGIRLDSLPDWLRNACERALDPSQPLASVQSLVRDACRSHEHVSRTMIRATGQTPTAFVNEIRLARGAFQLTMTDRSIARIALDCGFASLGHFYRQFRARYGNTPRRYRLLGG